MSKLNVFMRKVHHPSVAVIGFVLLIISGCSKQPEGPPPPSINPFPLPDFELTTPEGKPFSSDQIRGRICLINFWSSWSPSAIRQAGNLVELYKRYSDQGLLVVGIALEHGSSADDIRTFIAHSDLNYPIAVADRDFHHRFGGIDAIPTTFVVDPSGQITNRYTGVALPDELDREVQYLIARESEE